MIESILGTLARDSNKKISVIRPPLVYGVGAKADLLGTLLNVIGRQDTHDSLIGSLGLNISKAIATGWEPQVSLDEGLRLALSAQDA